MVTGSIRFLERCIVVAGADGLGHQRIAAIYEPGETYELPEPSCQRWLRRRKAVRVEREIDDGVQAEAQTEAQAELDVSTGPSAADDRTSDLASDAVVDSEVVAGKNRRPYRRRSQPDPD